MSSDLNSAWDSDGFFYLRGLVSAADAAAIESEVVAAVRADPPADHRGEAAYFSGPDTYIFPEPGAETGEPEGQVAKVFNCHACGTSRALALREDVVAHVAAILGEDIDCFQSQLIFKHPGVIGQPWHQDSFYFRFDRQPQVGVWVALQPATLENGCLWVMPGSHRAGTIFTHVPDRRPTALRGYLEIVDQDVSGEVPALMETGDVLIFHSYLMHRSTDNVADCRRSAIVYHYGQAGTAPVSATAAALLGPVNRWIPARRSGMS